MNLSIAGSGFNVVEFRRRGILKRLFVTPIKPIDFVSAIVIARMVIVLGQLTAIFGFAYDIRRNSMAGCFSCYKQLFAEGQEFTYGLEDLASYYNDYVELMDHWNKVLPNKILSVQYEDLG